MKHLLCLAFCLSSITGLAWAGDIKTVEKSLTEALQCKGKPADAVYDLVERGSDFQQGYSAMGFGEGTGYAAVAILKTPLKVGAAETSAVISQTENAYSDFAAFTYAEFKGDYKQIVKLLKLFPPQATAEFKMGEYVSIEPGAETSCPPTVLLTPLEGGTFLLGCGWCNGG